MLIKGLVAFLEILQCTFYHIHKVHSSVAIREVLLQISSSLVSLGGKTSLHGMPSRESISGLPYSRPTHYRLSYAAPFKMLFTVPKWRWPPTRTCRAPAVPERSTWPAGRRNRRPASCRRCWSRPRGRSRAPAGPRPSAACGRGWRTRGRTPCSWYRSGGRKEKAWVTTTKYSHT